MILSSGRRAEPTPRAVAIGAWKAPIALMGIAAIIFAMGFQREAISAVRTWIGTTAYNHCFLVVPIVVYLLWLRRAVILEHRPFTALWPLLLMPPLSLIWLLFAALDIVEARQLFVIAMFQVVLLISFGSELYKRLLAPMLLLFFLVPMGDFLLPRLQEITAQIAIAGLRVVHVPVFAEGYLIEIPEGRFQVAEACAGLRFLIAAVVFSCVFAIIMYSGWKRRLVYITLSPIVAIIANSIRVFGIILIAHLQGTTTAIVTDHVLYGWLFFLLVIVLLIGIGLLLTVPEAAQMSRPLAVNNTTPRRALWAIPAAALLALTGPALATWSTGSLRDRTFEQASAPSVATPWELDHSGAPIEWRPAIRDANWHSLERFVAQGGAKRVIRYVALYRLRVNGNRLTRSDNQFAGESWYTIRQNRRRVNLWGQSIPVLETELAAGSHHQIVWSFYVIGDSLAGSSFGAKYLQLRAMLRGQDIGALVMVATSADDGTQIAGASLASFLASSRSIPDYISALARR